jgi:hypothetical protein
MADDVYRAIDATLILGAGDTEFPDGTAAEAIVDDYDLSNVVGRLRNVTIAVTSDVRPFYEIGRRYPTQLRAGVVAVSGTAQRAHVNGALLRLLLGEGASSPPGEANFVQPDFNIVATLRDPARPESFARISIFGAKFDSWRYQIPSEDFVLEQASFHAKRTTFEES